jgi:anti-sigma factor RsiW
VDCNQVQPLLAAFADNELDLVRQLEIEQHLRTCGECARRVESLRARQAALARSLPRYAAPAGMADRLRAAVHAEATPLREAANAEAPEPAATTGKTPRTNRFPLWPALAMAASLALAVGTGYTWGNNQAARERLFDEAVADHVRSLQVGHLMDVASTDQHTVKPWFAGKLPFSPPVTDLANAGFPLIGGRLEYLGGRPAAALVFHRRQHAINVFIWHGDDVRHDAESERAGFHLQTWAHGDLNFAAVSEIPAPELAQFVAAYRSATE